ncbi:MAG TPA: bifunctional 5,10-methylenetetrahydrofolate dehydrogenase/5,10-methenyltetrahydrofolate cyclohydrolase [Candidatus Paceibacterota bacterium]|nr:bifunctional 5,10-methylenetetrahydrofolate dehydrogenase/5,10-methenyltetrahydrofolate cyclohydrolase [Candidatus Paceibacterota bacterium]
MIIDGKQISREVLKELKEDIRLKNLKLRLAAVLVSSNPGIRKFVELKGKAAKDVGIDYEIFEFPETISEDALRDEVRKIVQDEANDGVLVELPLPKGINAQNVLNEITLNKDVDVLSQEAQDKFYSNKSVILPPAAEAVRTVLEFYNFDLKGKKTAVFGYGLLVGKPVAHWLSQNGAYVSVIDEHTEDPQKHSIGADVIVSGVGKPGLIGGGMVKNGVVAIDFGYKNKDGKMVGDFKFDEVAPKASLITPVPGGIGPVVVAAVLKNLVK